MSPASAFRRFWVPITTLAAAVFGVLATYESAPMRLAWADSSDFDVSATVKWVTVVLISFTWLGSVLWPRTIQRRIWLRLAFVAVPLSIALLLANSYLTQSWSITYVSGNPIRLITGTQLADMGNQRQRSKPCRVDDAFCLVSGYGGNSKEVWVSSDLERRMWVITVVRAVSNLACVAAIMAIVMALAAKSLRSEPSNAKTS